MRITNSAAADSQATARSCLEAGANLLVTGSAVFGSSDPAAAYTSIAAAAGIG